MNTSQGLVISTVADAVYLDYTFASMSIPTIPVPFILRENYTQFNASLKCPRTTCTRLTMNLMSKTEMVCQPYSVSKKDKS